MVRIGIKDCQPLKCTHCKKLGHTQEKFWNLHGKTLRGGIQKQCSCQGNKDVDLTKLTRLLKRFQSNIIFSDEQGMFSKM